MGAFISKLSHEETEKLKKEVVSVWNTDTEMFLKDLHARFHRIGQERLKMWLKEYGVYPRGRPGLECVRHAPTPDNYFHGIGSWT